MSGIKDLDILLSNIEPVLDERNFVFCSFPTIDWKIMYELNPIGIFHEKEGVTFILEQQDAVNKKIHYQSVYRLITLNVHSSLDAVGLTAAFSAKLAEKNISTNVVTAYYHDHIFVPEEKAEQALNAILELQKGAVSKLRHIPFFFLI
ncbi:ACT domain-containing protein [Bacteroides faecis]